MSIIGLEVLHRSLSDFFPFANVLFFPCSNELEVGGCKEKLHWATFILKTNLSM